MEILAIKRPPSIPITAKDNIKVCTNLNCSAILRYGYEDMLVEPAQGHELNYIICPSCGTKIYVEGSKYRTE